MVDGEWLAVLRGRSGEIRVYEYVYEYELRTM
jgi:hypothetical protein